jgi:putative FmdB family regulatory protein
MPIYENQCQACGRELEEYRSITAPEPVCCGQPMKKLVSPCGMAMITKNGNWFHMTPTAGRVYKGGGRRKPETIGKGHGVGGRRPPPTMEKALASGSPIRGRLT